MTFEQKLPSAFRLLDNQFVCAEGSFLSAFSLVSSHFHHPIHIPLHRMHSLRTDERQCLAELVGVHPSWIYFSLNRSYVIGDLFADSETDIASSPPNKSIVVGFSLFFLT